MSWWILTKLDLVEHSSSRPILSHTLTHLHRLLSVPSSSSQPLASAGLRWPPHSPPPPPGFPRAPPHRLWFTSSLATSSSNHRPTSTLTSPTRKPSLSWTLSGPLRQRVGSTWWIRAWCRSWACWPSTTWCSPPPATSATSATRGGTLLPLRATR